jgi:hypothetical protein
LTPALDQVAGLKWAYAMDPHERQPFTVDWSKELEQTGAVITAAVWTLPATAAAGGLTNAAATFNRTEATIWLEVAELSQTSPLYDDTGTEYPIALQITDSVGRIYRRAILLTVQAQ